VLTVGAQFVAERKTMMQEWADYLDGIEQSGNVIHAQIDAPKQALNVDIRPVAQVPNE
jgi:hypothetical protein